MAARQRIFKIWDLDNDTFVVLDTVEQQIIGLDFKSQLTVLSSSITETPEIVVELCRTVHTDEGHWLYASSELPSWLNDERINAPVLLSQGAILSIGDRRLRYTIRSDFSSSRTGHHIRQPPPKPSRAARTDNLDGPVQETDKHGEAPKPQKPVDKKSSEQCSITADFTARPTNNQCANDKSNYQLVRIVASRILHLLKPFPDTFKSLSGTDILLRSLQDAAAWNEAELVSFVIAYDRILRSDFRDPDGDPFHLPLANLLAELLKTTFEHVANNILWLSLLNTLAQSAPNRVACIRYQVAPIVIGCMAAHSHDERVQRYACLLLAQLAAVKPQLGQKSIVGESGVELITYAMVNHRTDVFVQRHACQAIANIVTTNAAIAIDVISSGIQHFEVLRGHMTKIVALLEFIKRNAMHEILTALATFSEDGMLRTACGRVLAYYGDSQQDTDIVEHSAMFSNILDKVGKLQVRDETVDVSLEGAPLHADVPRDRFPCGAIGERYDLLATKDGRLSSPTENTPASLSRVMISYKCGAAVREMTPDILPTRSTPTCKAKISELTTANSTSKVGEICEHSVANDVTRRAEPVRRNSQLLDRESRVRKAMRSARGVTYEVSAKARNNRTDNDLAVRRDSQGAKKVVKGNEVIVTKSGTSANRTASAKRKPSWTELIRQQSISSCDSLRKGSVMGRKVNRTMDTQKIGKEASNISRSTSKAKLYAGKIVESHSGLKK